MFYKIGFFKPVQTDSTQSSNIRLHMFEDDSNSSYISLCRT